jgi:LuxR family maltose regulon positive regulatory protein
MLPTRAAVDSARAPEVQLRSRPRLLVYAYEHMWIAPVQVLLARGRDSGDPSALRHAFAELDALEADTRWLPWLRIKTLILRALAYHALDDALAALGTLRTAVGLAAPEGYVRVFADEGLALAPLLRAVGELTPQQERDPGYLERLLSAIGTPQPARSVGIGNPQHARLPATRQVEQLSARELEVLRLVAGGHSNAQIARELIIAISTVKTHLNSAFAKLGVVSRTQAIARARDLNLV